MRAIFISYRRDDAEGQAGRLFDDLSREFGAGAVFMDVAAIEPGRDFRRVIDEHVATCGVLLSLIGKGWLNAVDESGKRRLDDPLDFVRLETGSALKRDIPVVPVLVHSARMPRADELPDDLEELAFRNAVELTHSKWDSDVEVLIKALRPHVQVQQAGAQTSAAAPTSAAQPGPRTGGQLKVAVLAAGGLAAAALGIYLWQRSPADGPAQAADATRSSPAAKRTLLANDWAGSWHLRYEFQGKWHNAETMKISATPTKITGYYKIGAIYGTFAEGDYSRVTGDFENTAGSGVDCGGKQGGRFAFTMAEDAKSISGWWDICGKGEKFDWKADRL